MALIRVLAEDQPDELAHAYAEARNRGEQWHRALTHGANRMTGDVKAMLDQALAKSEAAPEAHLTPFVAPEESDRDRARSVADRGQAGSPQRDVEGDHGAQ